MAAWAAVIVPLVELMILRDMGQVKTKARTLNFRRVNFQLLKELVDGIPW